MASFLIEGSHRVGYNAMRHPVSSLSIGDSGWVQKINFFTAGALIVLFALGLRINMMPKGAFKWPATLIACAGGGLIGAGVFTADPFNGYPPGSPLVPIERTTSGILHDLASTFFFVGIPTSCLMLARLFSRHGNRVWARYSFISGIAFVVTFLVTSAGINQVGDLASVAGLFQRLTIAIGFTWLGAIAISMLKPARRSGDHIREPTHQPKPDRRTSAPMPPPPENGVQQ